MAGESRPPEPLQPRTLRHVEPRASVDLLLRTTVQSQAQLSSMADQKANIVLGVSFLALTVLLGRFQDSGLSTSLAVLAVFTLGAAFFALLTVMPSLPSRTRIDPASPGFNPLFFAFFSGMRSEDYMRHMEEIFQDDTRIYETVLRDIHQVGTLLHRYKYRYLAYSYRLLLAGIVLSLATIAVEWLVGTSALPG